MTKNKKRAIWVVAILIVVIGGWFLFFRKADEVEYKTEKVEKRDVFQTVSVTGDLKADEEILLNFEVSGRIKDISTKIGNKVAKGDNLAMIDDAVLGQELKKAKAVLEKAIADAGSSDDVIREAEEDLDNAEDYLEEVEKLENQKVDAADQAYDDAEDYYDDAKDYYDQVVADDGVDSATAKNAKMTMTSARNSRNTALETRDTARRTRDVNVTAAENTVEAEEEDLKTAESKFAKVSDDASVESARASYNIALVNLDKAALKAPVNGMITEINYEKGEVIGSGFSTASSGSFGKILSYDYLLEADVPESDVTKVKLSQKASVTFDAFDDSEVFEVEVVEIDPAATVVQDVVYYRVKLKVNDHDKRLKPGMSADVDIHTAERKNVLVVPQRAVSESEDGKVKTVEVLLEENKIQKREVKTGLKGDDGEIEIVSGLNEGEEVVTLKKNGDGK